MPIFEIRQEIPTDCINDDYVDITDIHIGFVSDEFFAQEFCNANKRCTYEEIKPILYLNHLKGNLVDSVDDLTVLKIPVHKEEE